MWHEVMHRCGTIPAKRLRGNHTQLALGTQKEKSKIHLGDAQLVTQPNTKHTWIFGRTQLIIDFIYHFTEHTVTVHKRKTNIQNIWNHTSIIKPRNCSSQNYTPLGTLVQWGAPIQKVKETQQYICLWRGSTWATGARLIQQSHVTPG